MASQEMGAGKNEGVDSIAEVVIWFLDTSKWIRSADFSHKWIVQGKDHTREDEGDFVVNYILKVCA